MFALRTIDIRAASRLGSNVRRGVGAGLAFLLAPSAAYAACNDNFGTFATVNGVPTPWQNLAPLGRGSSLAALTATLNTVNTAFLSGTGGFVAGPLNSPKADQAAGGLWGRAIGGSTEVSSHSEGTLVHGHPPTPGPDTGKQTCDATVRQDFAGVQVGYDVATVNIGGAGASFHFGLTGGYLNAFSRDTTAAAQVTFDGGQLFDAPAGSLKAQTDVHFMGAYLAFLQKGFYIDAQLRFDFYQNHLSDPNQGLTGQSLDANGISLTVNVGQNIPLGSGWYIEPSAGAVLSRVSFKTLNVPGISFDGGGGPGSACYACGRVEIDDVTSVLGRGTLKVGTSFAGQGAIWLPFLAASIFHEFDGDVTARSTTPDNPFINFANDTLTIRSSGGIGTYAQFGLGTSVVMGNTGWLGYGRFDYRTGDNIEGWSVNTGIRYQW